MDGSGTDKSGSFKIRQNIDFGCHVPTHGALWTLFHSNLCILQLANIFISAFLSNEVIVDLMRSWWAGRPVA